MDKKGAAPEEQEEKFALQEQKIDKTGNAITRQVLLLDKVNTSDGLAHPSRTSSTAAREDSGVLANAHAQLAENDRELDKRDVAREEPDEELALQDQKIASSLLDLQQDAPPSPLQRRTALPARRTLPAASAFKSAPRASAMRNSSGAPIKRKVHWPSNLNHPSREADQNQSRIFKKGRSSGVPQSPLGSAGVP